MKNKIKILAKYYKSDLIAIRRHIHSNPELSFEEYETSKYVKEILSKNNINYIDNIAKTGIVAIIEGKNKDSKTVALRADLDALPIIEANDVPYKSKNNGVMHACGHDVHIACLLGAAIILNKLKNEFDGTVKFIFQPSEEKFPGGAKIMIEEGVLENPKVDAIIALHTMPELEVGTVGFKSGQYMASTDELYITVNGKGGHAATPELNNDPIIIASELRLEIKKYFDNNSPKEIPTVVAFGKFIADGRTNIIPDFVKLEGTLRTFNEEWREKALKIIETICNDICNKYGAKCDVVIAKGYPYLVNDDNITKKAKAKAIEFLNNENVIDLNLRMTAEDFAYYSQIVPGCFFRLGISNKEKNIISNLHTNTFDVDEDAIEVGSGLMSWLALSELSDNN